MAAGSLEGTKFKEAGVRENGERPANMEILLGVLYQVLAVLIEELSIQ